MQPSRDDIIIDLANALPRDEVFHFLDLQQQLTDLDKEQLRAEIQHRQRLEEIENQSREIRLQCTHPHTWRDSGGQYEPQRTYCSICGAELK